MQNTMKKGGKTDAKSNLDKTMPAWASVAEHIPELDEYEKIHYSRILMSY